MTDNLPIAVSIPKAAEMLGIGRSTVYKLLGEGKLPWCKLGRRTLVPISAISNLMSDLTKKVR